MEFNGAHLKYDVTIRQQPLHARISAMKISADRRPVDPPIIVQLCVTDPRDIGASTSSPPKQSYPVPACHSHLTNPYYFMYAALIETRSDNEVKYVCDGGNPSTSGSLVSSVRVLKDYPNSDQDAAFFIFPNICVRMEGSWRFKLSLFVIDGDKVKLCATTYSDPFFVYQGKQYPGVQASTPLTRALAAQGVKLRIRQEIRQKHPVRTKEEDPLAFQDEPEDNTSSASTPDSSLSRSPPKRRRTLMSPMDALHSFDCPSPTDTSSAVHIPRQQSSNSHSSLYTPEKNTDGQFRRASLDAQLPQRSYMNREWFTPRVLEEYSLSTSSFNFNTKPESSDYHHGQWGLMRPAHSPPETNSGLSRQASVSGGERSAIYSWGTSTTGGRDLFSQSTTHADDQFSAPSTSFWQMNTPSSSIRSSFEQHAVAAAPRPTWYKG